MRVPSSRVSKNIQQPRAAEVAALLAASTEPSALEMEPAVMLVAVYGVGATGRVRMVKASGGEDGVDGEYGGGYRRDFAGKLFRWPEFAMPGALGELWREVKGRV
ncbi:hypothetical protein Tco_0360957 [Tanacetum coccineum]